MSGPFLVEALAERVAGVALPAVRASSRRQAARLLLDFVGCAALSAPHDFADAVVRVGERMGSQPECAVIGRPERLSAPSAALVHGTFAHGLEFDDSHLPSMGHLTAAVAPVVLALGEAVDASGADAVAALLVGLEAGGRLGKAATAPEWNGSALRARGFFATSVLGTIGAAASAARLLGLSTARTADALALACNAASGMSELANGDNWGKRSQPGWAAHAGLAAALLAAEGFTGPRTAFEGDRGFLRAFMDGRCRVASVIEGWGEGDWAVDEVTIKPYPVEHYVQTVLELIERCRAETRLDAEAIVDVEVSLPAQIRKPMFEPAGFKIAPPDSYAARYSGPYVLALALSTPAGRVVREDFHERFSRDPALHDLGRRIRFAPDAAFDAVFPVHAPGRIRLYGRRGPLWEGELADVYGSPFRPMSDDDLTAKFRENCGAWPAARREAALRAALGLETGRVRDLAAQMHGRPA